jgi:hypothetical protein
MSDKSWGVDYEKDEALKAHVYKLIQEKLASLGGIDEDFIDNIVKIIMINISKAMNRGPTEFKQDLDDIIEEDNVEKLLHWVQTDFQDQVRAFQASRAPAQPTPQNLDAKNIKTDGPTPTKNIAKSNEHEPVTKKDTPKEKASEKKVEAPQTQPKQTFNKESIKPEPLESGKRKQEKTNLAKRKPENHKKAENDEKKNIFDRIKPKEGAEQNQPSKKQGAPYHQQQRPQHPRRNESRQPDTDIHQSDHQGQDDTQMEEGARQAKLSNFLSKFKKQKKCVYFPNCKNPACEFVHPEENCPWFPKCAYGEACFYIHPEIMCKYGVYCQRENCSYKHPLVHKLAHMSNTTPYYPFPPRTGYPKKTNPKTTSQAEDNV